MSADLNQFIGQWTGKPDDYDSNSGPQCVDTVKRWAALNGMPVIKGNASAWYKAQGYEWVENTPSLVALPGWIAVFDIGEYGHVGVVAPGTTINTLITFDQNFPLGSAPKLVNHGSYAGIRQGSKWPRSGFLKIATVSKPKTYTVAKNDTLSKIAGMFGTTYQKIAALNGIKPPYVIHPGQVIKLP